MDMRLVLQYDLGPLPLSIALPDGCLVHVKTTKAKLLALLEGNTPPAATVLQNAARVIDAMALLQAITSIPPTFAELADLIFQIANSSGSHRVDFVADPLPGHKHKR